MNYFNGLLIMNEKEFIPFLQRLNQLS
ncbi:MAG: hypothetical protein ACI935_004020, partial [Moritella dasanensis]